MKFTPFTDISNEIYFKGYYLNSLNEEYYLKIDNISLNEENMIMNDKETVINNNNRDYNKNLSLQLLDINSYHSSNIQINDLVARLYNRLGWISDDIQNNININYKQYLDIDL
jgi:hypothetical protein